MPDRQTGRHEAEDAKNSMGMNRYPLTRLARSFAGGKDFIILSWGKQGMHKACLTALYFYLRPGEAFCGACFYIVCLVIPPEQDSDRACQRPRYITGQSQINLFHRLLLRDQQPRKAGEISGKITPTWCLTLTLVPV